MTDNKQYVDGRDWKKYRAANTTFPAVREQEINHMLNMINPTTKEVIVEMGTGNGVLTFPMAEKVSSSGRITTYDATEENVSSVVSRNKKMGLPIVGKTQNLDYSTKELSSGTDKVVSLAAFHHYDNYRDKTGFSGRLRAMKEFARILKPDGKVIIGDIATSTNSAKYFNSLDTPELCPGGHPHDFLNTQSASWLCKKAGLNLQKFEIENVPWTFTSITEAQTFINTIHGSVCSKEKSLEHAKRYLKFWKQNDKYYLEWSLFYLVATKR